MQAFHAIPEFQDSMELHNVQKEEQEQEQEEDQDQDQDHQFENQLDAMTLMFSTFSIGKKKGYKKAAEIAKRREREEAYKHEKEKVVFERQKRMEAVLAKRSMPPIIKKRQRKALSDASSTISSTACSSRSDYSNLSYELDLDAILEKLGAISFSNKDI
jgi:hypothetical protein